MALFPKLYGGQICNLEFLESRKQLTLIDVKCKSNDNDSMMIDTNQVNKTSQLPVTILHARQTKALFGLLCPPGQRMRFDRSARAMYSTNISNIFTIQTPKMGNVNIEKPRY